MIFALLAIGFMIAYVAAGSWTFGYLKVALDDCRDNGEWRAETPLPLLGSLVWPIVVLFPLLSFITSPAHQLGMGFRRKQLAKAEKRIADQEKVRIELEKAEKTLQEDERAMEEEFRALDRKERNKR